MKIVVLSGSPHKKGTSAALVEGFIKGAEEANHEVVRFDTSFMDVHACIACEKCHTSEDGKCAFQDDMNKINPELIAADCVVFASPIYYYNINTQLKAVVDRFYANDEKLHVNKKAILLTTMADTEMTSADAALVWIKECAKYLGWEVIPGVNAKGCYTVDKLDQSYVDQAYKLGKSL